MRFIFSLRSTIVVAAVFGTAALALLPSACASKTEAKSDTLCTAKAFVFCRCQDRQEGTKLCNDTGTGFGKCEPCETEGNPQIEVPPEQQKGVPPPDGGKDSSSGGTPTCSNGIVEEGEDCDDKNTINDDGCSNGCKIDGVATKGTSCPGLEVHVWGGSHAPSTTGSTKTSGNRDANPTCTSQIGNATTGAAASDRVFKVIAHKTGSLKVLTSDVNYDSFIYASTACAADGHIQQMACVNGVNGSGGELLSFPVDAGKTYWVFVDGAGIDPVLKEGNFRVTFSIP